MFKFNQFSVIAISTVLVACAQTTPKYDAKFGDAARATFQQQIINPNAGTNPDTVSGIDGKAANNVMTNYQKSFSVPDKTTNVFNVGVGTGDSGSNAK